MTVPDSAAAMTRSKPRTAEPLCLIDRRGTSLVVVHQPKFARVETACGPVNFPRTATDLCGHLPQAPGGPTNEVGHLGLSTRRRSIVAAVVHLADANLGRLA
jgi:hypothetical protein